jgi:acetyltransferase-like isoleucine patch superfamily enzyme
MSDLGHQGKDAMVYPTAKIIRPENLWLGDHSTIDDFVFLNAGAGTRIGRYVHIASHASIIGGGMLEVGDYGVVATGARVLTATDTYRDGHRMSTHLPDEYRNVYTAPVNIERDAFVGANAVVFPGVTIGEGAVVGAGAVVTSDLDPWTVYVGAPARRLKERPRPLRDGP